MSAKMADLAEQVTELKLKVETAERERDFYFDKLRDIEILCQAPELADIPVSHPYPAGCAPLRSACCCYICLPASASAAFKAGFLVRKDA